MLTLTNTPVSDLTPNPDAVRTRLAFLLTEAAVLPRQLKVSERATREAERLRQLARGGVGREPSSAARPA